MTELTPATRRIALFALALGGFGIGVTEFATMGLLPDIAENLLPGFADSPNTVIAQAGIIITTYALGVVVGAPLLAVFGARMSQTTLTFWLLGLFIFGSIASACMPTFESLAVFRFVSALPHGAYFGVASLLAGRIMGPGKQGRGVALALSGLTIANVLGVPFATWLGQNFGWRSAYVVVALIFALTLLLTYLFLPRYPGDPSRSPLRELSALRNPRIWLMIGIGSVGFGGFFAVYAYVAEVVTRVTKLDPTVVPWALACLGLGMTLGNLLGGWLTDRNTKVTIYGGFAAFIAALAVYTQFASSALGLFICVFFLGFTSSMLIPSIQARLIRISNEAALLGAAINHAAFNIGNALGAWIGGAVIAAGFGYVAPGWVGVMLAVLGLGLAIVSFAVQRWDQRRSLDTSGIPVTPAD